MAASCQSNQLATDSDGDAGLSSDTTFVSTLITRTCPLPAPVSNGTKGPVLPRQRPESDLRGLREIRPCGPVLGLLLPESIGLRIPLTDRGQRSAFAGAPSLGCQGFGSSNRPCSTSFQQCYDPRSRRLLFCAYSSRWSLYNVGRTFSARPTPHPSTGSSQGGRFGISRTGRVFWRGVGSLFASCRQSWSTWDTGSTWVSCDRFRSRCPRRCTVFDGGWRTSKPPIRPNGFAKSHTAPDIVAGGAKAGSASTAKDVPATTRSVRLPR